MTFARDASTPAAKAVFALIASLSLAAAFWWLVGTAQQQADFQPMPLVAPLPPEAPAAKPPRALKSTRPPP